MHTLRIALMSFALTLVAGGVSFAQSLPVGTPDVRMLPYVEPGQQVDIGGGQRVNLKCLGSGEPTVVLMAGFSSWSLVWYKTQPEIAKRTRVCTFDRPGFGFSDPAPQPLILNDVPEALHKALKAANLLGPYVLVGHSLGGLEARMFAERWPKEVVGMILLDTSVSGQILHAHGLLGAADTATEEYFTDPMKCAALASRGPISTSSPCITPLPPETPLALRETWTRFFGPNYWSAQISLTSSLFTRRYDSADHFHLGDKPLVVLQEDPATRQNAPKNVRAGLEWWFDGQKALVHLSSRGVFRIVKGSSHSIEIDKPQAVIDAVDEVLRALQGRSH